MRILLHISMFYIAAIGDYLTILGLTKNDWGLWLPIIHSDEFRIFRG